MRPILERASRHRLARGHHRELPRPRRQAAALPGADSRALSRWSCTACRCRSAARIPLDREYLAAVRALGRTHRAAWISDHLCWTGVEGRNLHDLLPLPYTEEALATVVARVGEVQDALGRQILLENVSSYLDVPRIGDERMGIPERSRAARGLRDLARHQQHLREQREPRVRPLRYLRAVPKERVRQFHLAGHSDLGGHLIDTHDHPIVGAGLESLSRGRRALRRGADHDRARRQHPDA